jgi:hypothetical protein
MSSRLDSPYHPGTVALEVGFLRSALHFLYTCDGMGTILNEK